jgi:hypothetical protein
VARFVVSGVAQFSGSYLFIREVSHVRLIWSVPLAKVQLTDKAATPKVVCIVRMVRWADEGSDQDIRTLVVGKLPSGG